MLLPFLAPLACAALLMGGRMLKRRVAASAKRGRATVARPQPASAGDGGVFTARVTLTEAEALEFVLVVYTYDTAGVTFPEDGNRAWAWYGTELVPPLTWKLVGSVLPTSIVIALIGLIESLMTLELVTELTKTPGDARRECLGQGLANVIAGAFGSMGGCAMIGQSMINVHSNGTRRLSGIVAAHAIGAQYPFEGNVEAKKDFQRLRSLMGI